MTSIEEKFRIGEEGEIKAKVLLENDGWSVARYFPGSHEPLDLLASKDGETLAINVKFTPSGQTFVIQSQSLHRLIKVCELRNWIPAYLLLDEREEHSLFVMRMR